jgi:hypothetical protein
MGFERPEDVHKVQRVIAKRFARFGLKINTEKTRLVRFGRPSRAGGRSGDKPEPFSTRLHREKRLIYQKPQRW